MTDPRDLETRIDQLIDTHQPDEDERREIKLMQAFLEDPRVAGNTSGEPLPAQVFVDHAEALNVAGVELARFRDTAAQEAL